MKKLVTLFLIIICFQGLAQQADILSKPKADKRVELLSIVFRLAERPEYSYTKFKLYTDRIENHFSKYKNHELIQFTKSIMDKNRIGYDAVMLMAVHLDENLNLLEGVTDTSVDGRWNQENTTKFLALLKKFCKDTKYDKFYKENTELYLEASKRFIPIYDQIDLKWYTNFYGKEPTEKFVIINGLGNGNANYGPSVDYKNGEKTVYAILGTWVVDSLGMPEYSFQKYFPILLHEFNHSFVNYLFVKNEELFKNSGEQLFSVVKDKMKNQAYGHWQTMMNEALVRASVIKYMQDHHFDKNEIENQIKADLDRGFLWIKALVSELNNYDKNRNTYHTLEEYIPELAKAYEGYAKKLLQFESKRPEVISINEFSNGDKNVEADVKTITINFDKPLSGKGYSVFYGNKGENAFPKINQINYANDNQSVIMEVTLEKNKEYQFIMKGKSFMSKEGIVIKDYEVNFKTGK